MGADPRGWNVRSISELDRSTSPPDRRPRRTPDRGRPAGRGLRHDRRAEHHASSPPRPPSHRPRSRARAPSGRWPTPPTARLRAARQEAPDAAHAAYTGQIRRISSTDPETVVFELCGPDVAFRSKIAAPAFAINDTGWLESHIDPAATGAQAIVSEVNGTGPYRLESWNHGSEVSLARNDDYWGDEALNERLIVRWYDNPGQRFAELQNATVDGIDDVFPSTVAAVTDDVGLALQTRPGLNVSYLGFTNTFAPFDDERVRRAIAMGIDRQRIVDTFFPPGSELATHYAPCAIPHGCTGDPWYEFDPILGKETLAAAGYPDGFDTKIQYREAAQPYPPRSDRRRHRAQDPAAGQSRHPRRARAHARGHLPGRRRRGQARRDPPARPERDLPRRRRVPRSALRAGRLG